MLWSAVLDIATVLAFVYMIMAVVSSLVLELGASVVGGRGRSLRSGLASLLNDPNMTSLVARLYDHPQVGSQPSSVLGSLLKRLRGPSDVPHGTLAIALTDVMNREGGFTGTLLKPEIAALVCASGNDPAAFQTAAEAWFKGLMDQLSGVYKRRAQVFLFVIALLIAVFYNVDTFQITRTVAGLNQEERTNLITVMTKLSGTKQESGTAEMSSIVKLLNEYAEYLTSGTNTITYQKPTSASGWLSKLIGWLITAYAASLGSHAWFNLLQAALRLSGYGRR
ncbi:conserved membrane hypothetical protein [uncultured Gammaproteobacteria bacterium]